MHRARLRDAGEVVAHQVDDHHVLGAFLRARRAAGRRSAASSAGVRPRGAVPFIGRIRIRSPLVEEEFRAGTRPRSGRCPGTRCGAALAEREVPVERQRVRPASLHADGWSGCTGTSHRAAIFACTASNGGVRRSPRPSPATRCRRPVTPRKPGARRPGAPRRSVATPNQARGSPGTASWVVERPDRVRRRPRRPRSRTPTGRAPTRRRPRRAWA